MKRYALRKIGTSLYFNDQDILVGMEDEFRADIRLYYSRRQAEWAQMRRHELVPSQPMEVVEFDLISRDMPDLPFDLALNNLIHRWCQWCVQHQQVVTLQEWQTFTLPLEDCELIQQAYQSRN